MSSPIIEHTCIKYTCITCGKNKETMLGIRVTLNASGQSLQHIILFACSMECSEAFTTKCSKTFLEWSETASQNTGKA